VQLQNGINTEYKTTGLFIGFVGLHPCILFKK